MKISRFTDSQIMSILKSAESGMPVLNSPGYQAFSMKWVK